MANPSPIRLPRCQPPPALFAREALVVRQVVCLSHEGIDSADGIAPRLRQGNERIIEILGFAFGNCPALRIGRTQFMVVNQARSGRLPCRLAPLQEPEKRKQLAAHCPQREAKLDALRNSRTTAQHVVISPLNRTQNLEAPSAEQVQ